MKKSNLFSFAAVGGAIVFLCANTSGALNAYMTVQGQKQGMIKGGVTQKGREGKIMVIAAEHEVVSPRDASTGQMTQKMQHRPFEVTVEWDIATPRLYAAMFANELLPSVTVDFWAPQLSSAGAVGAEMNYMTVKLTNANIASIRTRMPNSRMPDTARLREQMEISFAYQKIEIISNQGGGTATGGLGGPGLLALLESGGFQPEKNEGRHLALD